MSPLILIKFSCFLPLPPSYFLTGAGDNPSMRQSLVAYYYYFLSSHLNKKGTKFYVPLLNQTFIPHRLGAKGIFFTFNHFKVPN